MSIQKVINVTIITYVTLVLVVISASRQGAYWRPLQVSHSRLSVGSRQSGSRDLQSTINQRPIKVTCSFACHQTEWCNLWCQDPASTSTCLLYDMYVVVGYQETNLADVLTCYTRSPIDFAVGASIEGPVPYPNVLQQVKENLVDGIYDYENRRQCYSPDDNTDPWFKVDIGSVKFIRQVKLVAFPGPFAEDIYDIEVSVGIENATSQSDFEKYKPFGYFPGPSAANKEIIFVPESPIKARYVLIQRWGDPEFCSPSVVNTCRLTICHMEIN